MIKISEINPTIFSKLQEINPTCKIFSVFGGTDLDDLYIAKFGERYTSDNLDSTKTAKYLNMLYSDNWDNAYDLFNASGATMGELGSIKSTTITKDTDYTDTTNDTDSVPVYDSTDLAVERNNDRSFNHKVNTDITTTIEDTKDISRFSQSIDYLKKNYLYDIVFEDVNSFVTYSILD